MNGQSKSGSGCFWGGCLAVIIAVLVITGLFVLGGYGIYRKALSYTSDKPASIPVRETTEEEYKQLSDRIAVFRKAFDANQEAEMELSDDEINMIIAMDPKWKDFRGKTQVKFESDQALVNGSFPLEGVPGFKGRYLNAVVTFNVSVEEGQINIEPVNIDLGGKKLPEDFEKGLKDGFKQDFSTKMREDQNTRKVLDRIKNLFISHNKLIIQTAPSQAPPATPSPGSTNEAPQSETQ